MERKFAVILAISILSSIIILFLLVLLITRLLRIYKKKQSEFIDDIQLLKFEKEKEILNTRIEAQEETFQIIGREIHDNINQLLTLSKLNLNSIILIDQNEITSKIDNSLLFITEAIKGLTNISRSLNSDLIKEVGIKDALVDEINRINSFSNTKIILSITEEINDINPNIQLLIFRITQESIRNAIVHGNASVVNINLMISEFKVIFEISDNGKGFDLLLLKQKKISQGLKNIEKRVTLVYGEFKINSIVGSGTVITITIPYVR